MTFGQLGMKHPSLAGMVDAIQNKISRVSLHEKFSESAVEYLENCLNFILKKKTKTNPIQTKLFKKFNRVIILDSSSWDINPKLSNILGGSGGSASIANCKLQTFYEYKKSELSFFEITPGTNPDNKYTKEISNKIKSKDLLLLDLGYYCLKTFFEITNKKAFFISRLKGGAKIYDRNKSKIIILEKTLKNIKGNAFHMDIKMGLEQQVKFNCRLICLRMPEEVSNIRRMRLIKNAKRKGRTPSNTTLLLAEWTLIITNVPETWIPSKMVWPIYTIRWQIELIFKSMKSILHIHHSNTANINRLKCEIYGKLICAVLIHRIHGVINCNLWNNSKKELSFDKLYKRIQERGFYIMLLFLQSTNKVVEYFSIEIKRLISNCIKYHQPSRISSLQLVDQEGDIEVVELKCIS